MTDATRPRPVILVAEDNEDHALFIRRAFKDSDVTIVHKEDGEEALAFLSDPNNPVPMLALLDVNMPRLSGLELLRSIRSIPRLKWVAVVMFSTSSSRADVREAYESGANSYVPKPMGFAEFQAKLKEVGEYWTQINRSAL
ncbi:MAG TPA: response regulator [Deinococcales bacterium]|nr:response regulator [Deinococcales bacterium]